MIGYHCSHELLPPDDLLRAVQEAERAGFDAAMCSDHFAPWSRDQGHSGFAWSWLAAALATTRLSFGTVTAPGQRYHPAIVAQAIATLGILFPGRFWAALGSGEAVNEHITGDRWPSKTERDERWEASADVIRRLLAGEVVDADGAVRVHAARLWSRPETPPAVLAAAVGPAAARRAAAWADGLITVGGDPAALREVVDAYRDAGGTGPAYVQIALAWAPTDAEASAIALRHWRHGAAVPPPELWDLEQPDDFDERSADVDADAVRAGVLVEHDPGRLAERVAGILGAGFDGAYLHHVGTEQTGFLAMAHDRLLPALRGAA